MDEIKEMLEALTLKMNDRNSKAEHERGYREESKQSMERSQISKRRLELKERQRRNAEMGMVEPRSRRSVCLKPK